MKLFFINLRLELISVVEDLTIDDSYARVCVPNKVKNMNVKVSNLMSGVNKIRFLVQHESSECKCGLNKKVYVIQSKNGIMMNFGVTVNN